MAKTTKPERKAFERLDEAARAAKKAEKAAKDLSGKRAKKVAALAEAAREVAETGAKKVRKHPKRVRAKAEDAVEALEKAAKKARAKAERDAEAPRAEAEALAAVRGLPKDDAPQAPAVAAPADGELAGLTVAQLRERARATGRPGYSRLTKAGLIEFLGG